MLSSTPEPGSAAPRTDRYSYRSAVINRLRRSEYSFACGRLTIRVARHFGFCWGVDQAVSMVNAAIAAEAHPQIWLLSQIIHNPTVNRDLVARGVRFLKGEGAPADSFALVRPEDLVVIPAFAAEVEDLRRVQEIGCSVLDTTCPWVERPHRRAERLVAAGYTLVIHGKVNHDETRATCSLILDRGGAYIVVLDLDEVDSVCRYLRGESDAAELCREFAGSMSAGFDPERNLRRFGVINQTTMLASESREIARRLGAVMGGQSSDRDLGEAFQDFDTICSATQENQNAVLDLVASPDLDLMLVVGGHESSNTNNLARVAAQRVPTYHIEDASAIGNDQLKHKVLDRAELTTAHDWLPDGAVTIGFTAGASTPDDTLGEVILRVAEVAGVEPRSLLDPDTDEEETADARHCNREDQRVNRD